MTSGVPLSTEYGTAASDPGSLARLRSEIASELGEEYVTSAPERLDAYTADTYWLALHARAAGTPIGRPSWSSRRATKPAWRPCSARGGRPRVPVVAWGGGSGTQGGSVPVSGGVVLDLTRLDRIIEIDERSLTVTCEPGVNGAGSSASSTSAA